MAGDESSTAAPLDHWGMRLRSLLARTTGGCGRGFGLKFFVILETNGDGIRAMQMAAPMLSHRLCEPTGPRKARPANGLREAIRFFVTGRFWIASSLPPSLFGGQVAPGNDGV